MDNGPGILEQTAFLWAGMINAAWAIFITLLLAAAVTLVVLWLFARLERRLVKRKQILGEPFSESTKRVDTLIRLIRRSVVLVLWAAVGLSIVANLGVQIAPILAGAGIIGLAIGFGAQTLVRDVISGFFIILENQVRVGDVAVVNGTGGLVEQINFRTLVLRDLAGEVHIFPNGSIERLSNKTNVWSAYVFDIAVAYKENTDHVVQVIEQVIEQLRQDPQPGRYIIGYDIFGVDRFADSAVIIRGRIKTVPIQQWMVGREFNRRIKLAFDAADIEIPFPHRTLYWGESSRPMELDLLGTGGPPERRQQS